MLWLFKHPAAWFITVMVLWVLLFLFPSSRNDGEGVGDKDDREGSG